MFADKVAFFVQSDKGVASDNVNHVSAEKQADQQEGNGNPQKHLGGKLKIFDRIQHVFSRQTRSCERAQRVRS
jgi:hypothetical protein